MLAVPPSCKRVTNLANPPENGIRAAVLRERMSGLRRTWSQLFQVVLSTTPHGTRRMLQPPNASVTPHSWLVGSSGHGCRHRGGVKFLNRVEQVLDELDPGLSVRLRALKMRLRRDPDWRLIQDLMPRGGVGVDVGANRGVYTSLMSARAGAGGRVHAIEPLPAYGERLRTIGGRRGTVSVHVCAVSDQAGSGML